MKKSITLLITVVILSTSALFAQGMVVNNKTVEDLKKPVMNSMKSPVNTQSKSVRSVYSDPLYPGAFYLECGSQVSAYYIEDEDGNIEFITGNNYYGFVSYGQILRHSETDYSVSTVQAYMVNTYSEGTQSVVAKLYELGSDNLPSTLLGTSDAVSTDNISSESIEVVTFNFSTPVVVPENFVVVIDLPSYTAGSAIIVIATSEAACYGEAASVVSYYYTSEGEGWYNLNEVWETEDENSFELAIFLNTEFESESGGSTNLNSENELAFTVSPNPVADVVYIANAAESDVRIYDMTGKIMIEKTIKSSNETIGVNSLEKGVYFIEVTKDNNKSTQKLIKK